MLELCSHNIFSASQRMPGIINVMTMVLQSGILFLSQCNLFFIMVAYKHNIMKKREEGKIRLKNDRDAITF